MEKKDSETGLIGVVADIISADKKFETAIETALGGNIQNIVTKDEVVAKKMISYLKEHKLGRATFLPLTTVRARGEFKYSEIKSEKGFLGIASDIVKADKKYDDVVSQLLGEIAVVDTVDNALAMAKNMLYFHKAPTWQETFEKIAQITGQQLCDVANELFDTKRTFLFSYR